MLRRALITGVAGREGSDLAALLLEKGYEVHGRVRRTSITGRPWIYHLQQSGRGPTAGRFFLHLRGCGGRAEAQGASRLDRDAMDVLEAVRRIKAKTPARSYRVPASAMSGKAQAVPQGEDTPFQPRSDLLLGDASKAHNTLGWQPRVTFARLAPIMVDADLQWVREHFKQP